jgi:drug/metabolite transporter (DMT)-like permease
MNRKFLLIFLLVFTITTWGYSWVLMKMGLEYAEPFTFAAWRCGIAAVAMIIYVIVKSTKLPKLNKLPDYFMIGMFQTTLLFGLMLYGMQSVTAGKTSVLLYTMPIWTVLMVHFYLKERLNTAKWIGVVIGTLGIIFILGRDSFVYHDLKVFTGELLVTGAAISWAISNIWMKKRMGGENIYMLSAIQLTIGTLGLALLAIPAEGLLIIEWNAHSLYILLFTGIIASAVDFTIWFYLLNNMDIKITTFSSMLVPVFGLIFDWIILGNRLDLGVIIGGALILFGIYQVSKK